MLYRNPHSGSVFLDYNLAVCKYVSGTGDPSGISCFCCPKAFYLIVASVMIGFAVYCAGVIGFVGLVIPHVIRILFGTDHRRLLPLSALLGASFLIWCDVHGI